MSRLTQERLREYFGRDSEVLYPPLDTGLFLPVAEDEEYSLVVNALNPYKRVDLALEACTRPLAAALAAFRPKKFSKQRCHENTLHFSKQRFQEAYRAFIAGVLTEDAGNLSRK